MKLYLCISAWFIILFYFWTKTRISKITKK